MKNTLPRALRIILSVTLPISVATVAVQLHHVNNTTVALTLLTGVLSLALTGEWWEALIAAVASALSLDYFALPPHGFAIRGPEQVVAFVTFLVTAIVMGQLFARANRHREEALRRQAELEKLNWLSNAMSACQSAKGIGQTIADALTQAFELEAAAVYDQPSGQIYRSGSQGRFVADERLRTVAASKELFEDLTANVSIVPFYENESVAGSVGMAGTHMSRVLLGAIAAKTSAAFARARAEESAREAEILRRTQEFKSALMDALAHEARNSLNSIKLAATNLLSDCPGSSGQRREMLTLINSETDHMNDWLSESIRLTRVNAAELTRHKSAHDMRGVILGALEAVRPLLQGRDVSVKTADLLPLVDCDASMIQRALQLLLENAAKYSPAGSPIRVSSDQFDDLVVVRVADEGPGVAEGEQDRIFEKNYRGRNERSHVPGMGVGLASAKYFVESNGGEIWVTNAPEGGAVFQFSLPASKPEVAKDELENDELENSYRG